MPADGTVVLLYPNVHTALRFVTFPAPAGPPPSATFTLAIPAFASVGAGKFAALSEAVVTWL